MTKAILTLILMSVICADLSAQNFEKAENTPFINVSSSAIAFGDLNGDGYDDLVISGYTNIDNGSALKTILYFNDAGEFFESEEQAFTNVRGGSIAMGDLDNDKDLDVLISGIDSVDNVISQLYINDGKGSFTPDNKNTFKGAWRGSINLADLDSDEDLDVIITGFNKGINVTKMYINDGQASFTENGEFKFTRVSDSSIGIFDVDNDEDLDLLICGQVNSFDQASILYINNKGLFEKSDIDFTGVREGSISLGDIDNDKDDDVFLSGYNSDDGYSSIIYLNNTGTFTKQSNIEITGVQRSSSSFSDIDLDGDLDLLISGQSGKGERMSKFYNNDGQGNFTENTEIELPGLDSGSISFSDIDLDGDEDLLITGGLSGGLLSPRTMLFINNIVK